MSGFLGEIDRRKQQGIQEELARKAKTEKQISLDAQKSATELTQRKNAHEVNSAGFISDHRIIIPILEQFDRLGYRDYFKSVSEISGFYPDWLIYINYPRHDLGPADSKIPLRNIESGEKGSESSREQLRLEKEMNQLCSKLFSPTAMGASNSASAMPTDDEFFIDKKNFIDKNFRKRNSLEKFFGKKEAYTSPFTIRFNEPKEIALGIKLTKVIDSDCSFEDNNTIKQGMEEIYFNPATNLRRYRAWWDKLDQHWYSAVYVRITRGNMATITGESLQLHADASNIKMFDDSLGKIMIDPLTIYKKEIRRSYEESDNKPSEPGFGGG